VCVDTNYSEASIMVLIKDSAFTLKITMHFRMNLQITWT